MINYSLMLLMQRHKQISLCIKRDIDLNFSTTQILIFEHIVVVSDMLKMCDQKVF